MATAEQLLHEAQYAFQSITYGESPDNRRNRRRASALSRKILRTFPTSTEAAGARALLKRLGEEAYTSQLAVVHQHSDQYTIPTKTDVPISLGTTSDDDIVSLDWGGLWSLIGKVPKTAWGVLAFVALIFFDLFGFFIFLPLLALLVFVDPFRRLMKPKERRELNQFVIQANAWIDERHRRSGGSA